MPFRSERQRRAMWAKVRRHYQEPHAEAERPSMFGPARDPRLAEAISIETPDDAKISVETVARMVAQRDISERHAKRAMVLAANRAEASMKRHEAPLSQKEMGEMRQVAAVYREAAGGM